MTTRRALIMGGGLGGPVAAMALERAGIQATVYEAADTPADHGRLFLNTSSNGLDVLRTLGVDTAGQAESFPMPHMVMWSGTGKRLGEVANGIRLPDGTNSVALRRGLLKRALREEAERRGVRFELGTHDAGQRAAWPLEEAEHHRHPGQARPGTAAAEAAAPADPDAQGHRGAGRPPARRRTVG